MTEPVTGATAEAQSATETCAQCSKRLAPQDRVAAGGKLFCRSCFESLKADLRQAFDQMSTNVNYVNGTIGAVLGGALGALVWWGFTVATKLGLGLVAIVIGFLAGQGAVRFTGGKRSSGLQLIAAAAAAASFVLATYLVNMTFANRALAADGDTRRLHFPPQSWDTFVRVVSADFGVMDLVFLAIVVYYAWRIPKPIPIPAELTT